MRHANDLKFDLALVSRDWKKLNLIFCRLSNGLFLNLGATCFCSEWQARANRLQLPKAQDCEWATFPVALLRASPSSQPPSLHLESDTDGQEWAFLYVQVHTSTWWYKMVRTKIYSYILVHTSMYKYHTFQNGTYRYVLYFDTSSYFMLWGCNMMCKPHWTTLPCTAYDVICQSE